MGAGPEPVDDLLGPGAAARVVEGADLVGGEGLAVRGVLVAHARRIGGGFSVVDFDGGGEDQSLDRDEMADGVILPHNAAQGEGQGDEAREQQENAEEPAHGETIPRRVAARRLGRGKGRREFSGFFGGQADNF